MRAEVPPRKLPHEAVGLGGAATVPIGTMRICGCGCRRWFYNALYFNGQWHEEVWRRVLWTQWIKRWRIRQATR